MVENHDEALRVWRSAGVRGCTLLHVDAHHDSWFCESENDLTIANFVSLAMREGLVDEFFWVVPDGSWANRETRRHVLMHLTRIAEEHKAQRPQVFAESMSVVLQGKRLTAVPLNHLPPISQPVLLDLDTDFLVIPRSTYGATDVCGALPWCWPHELLHRLAALDIKPQLATVAYSVTGGYTPLEWRYLGVELAMRLCGEDAAPADLLRAGATAEVSGDVAAAKNFYRKAAEMLSSVPGKSRPLSAAAWYRMALLLRESGQGSQAQHCYRRAIEEDGAYRNPYRSRGFALHWERRYETAERAHRDALQLEPRDPFTRFGLGQSLAALQRWAEAQEELRAACALDPELPDAQLALGDVLYRNGKHAESAAAYERFLLLTLSGRKTMQAPICTSDHPRNFDPQHFRAHARRAAALARLGRHHEAAQEYRMAMAAHRFDLKARFGLAQCRWRLGQKGAALAELARLLPAAGAKTTRNMRWLCRRQAALVRAKLALGHGTSGH